MIKAVIFDMDGTLLDSEVLKAKAWRQALKEYGVDDGDEFYRKNIGNTGTVIAKNAINEFSLSVDPNNISERRSKIYSILLKQGAEPIHSTMEFLSSMAQEKIKLGLASSERKDIILEQLLLAGAYEFFDAVTSGKDEAKNNKPNPEVYLITARKLNVNPSECVVIEDSAPGIEAAKRAGMMCIGYKNPHSGNQDLSKADFVVDDLSLASLSGIFKYLFSTFKIMADKIKTIEAMESILKGLKANNKKIVTTNGSFDILHAAHINLLEKAKAEGDILIILLNSDSSIKRNKGEKRPIVSETERAKMLTALRAVDYVVIFDEDKPLRYLEKIKPNAHVKGGSWDAVRMAEEKKVVESWGGRYINFPLEEGFSTTNIIEKILNAYK